MLTDWPKKTANLRIFGDEAGKMNRSLPDIGGEALVVSQFALYGDARKGRRPSCTTAAPLETAEPLVTRDALCRGPPAAGHSGRDGCFWCHDAGRNPQRWPGNAHVRTRSTHQSCPSDV